MNSESIDIQIDQVLDGVNFNDDYLTMNGNESDHLNCKLLKKQNHNEEKSKIKNENIDLEALQRTLVERKILLCNLQIDIARKQLEAFVKPSPANLDNNSDNEMNKYTNV